MRLLNLAALSLAAPIVSVAVTPAAAQQVNMADPGMFVTTLSQTGFSALKRGTGPSSRTQFRQLLGQYFAIDAIGDRLIRRWSPQITPTQRTAYKAAFPNFIIGTYADRLAVYSDAQVKVVRVTLGAAGASVQTLVTRPGQRPITAVWSLQGGPGSYKVSNLVVNGINLALAQSADFDSVVQSRGFNALIAMMRQRG